MFTDPDPELDNALALAKSDTQQATKVLRIAADYLKKMKPMPSALAFFLADAFERAMKRPTTSRGQELLVNLYLEVTHRRPKANFEWVGVDLEELIHAKVSKGEAIIQVGENYGISIATVKRMHKKYLEIKASEDGEDVLIFETELLHYTQQPTTKR